MPPGVSDLKGTIQRDFAGPAGRIGEVYLRFSPTVVRAGDPAGACPDRETGMIITGRGRAVIGGADLNAAAPAICSGMDLVTDWLKKGMVGVDKQ